MTTHPKTALNTAPSNQGFPTAARVLDQIDDWIDLAPAYRKRLKTLVRALPKLLGKPLEAITLDPEVLRAPLLQATAAQWGVSHSTLTVYRSAGRALLRRLGLIATRQTKAKEMSEAWRGLLDLLPPNFEMTRIVPFAVFCNGHAIPPGVVDAGTVDLYAKHLDAALAVRSSRRVVRLLVKAWNECITSVEGWSARPLAVPAARCATYSPPFTAYPASFQADLEAFRRRLSPEQSDRLYQDAESAPLARPLRRASVTARMNALRLAAGALVLSGRPIETVTTLGDLVTEPARRAICQWHWDRANRCASSNTASIAGTLRILARHHCCLDEAELRKLIVDIAWLIPRPTAEMTDKNLTRLRQFEDPRKLAALMHLPEHLMREAEALKARGLKSQAAWQAGVAAAIEIELTMPLRLKNLTELRLGVHIRSLMDRRAATIAHIFIPATEVKNATALHWKLRPEAVALLRRYINDFRSLLPHADSDALFPNRDHKAMAREQGGLGKAIGEAVRRHIGATLNTHLFRALAGVLVLRENPEAIADLRMLLGHHTLDTTLRFYAVLTRDQAAERHAVRIGKLRAETNILAQATLAGRSGRRAQASRRGVR